jgi:predicted transcriptional regulator of viral defense system
MSDTPHDRLYALAEPQAGFFSAGQALAAGIDRSTLAHHARPAGRYERIRRGLYRLRHFPTGRFDHVYAAWVPLRDTGAVVSHESALDLYELSDLIPALVDITVPRAKRGQRPRPGVRLHTTEHPPRPDEIQWMLGLPVSTPERAIVDAFEAASQPDQLELAVQQALGRALTTPRRLRAAAAARSARAGAFVERMLEDAGAA